MEKTKLSAFRELIREEVRAVFKEELAAILKEALLAKGQNTTAVAKQPQAREQKSIKNPVFEDRRPVFKVPGTTNPVLQNLLTDTANNIDFEEFTTGESINENSLGYDEPATVADMIASSRKSTNVEAVSISKVPDFSAILDQFGIGKKG